MKDWSLVYTDFDPKQEGLREALCTLGNGYFATRGAAPESPASGVHYPGTYLAGGYNRLKTDIAGRTIENEDLVNLPNWIAITFRIEDGEWFDLQAVEILSYRQELDLRRGLLRRTVSFRDREGRETMFRLVRLVHMKHAHLAAQEITLRAGNWSGQVAIRSALDGRVKNTGVERYRNLNGKHLRPVREAMMEEADGVFLEVETTQSRLHIAEAARATLFRDGLPLSRPPRILREAGYIAQEFTTDIDRGVEIRVDKIAALYTSRDTAIAECAAAAGKEVKQAGSFRDLAESQALAWEHLWRWFGMEMTNHGSGSDADQIPLTLRLHIFHLLQTVSLHTTDLDVGVPSRGWHGEAYRGHIFWDELFIFPIFNLRLPKITRSLLKYRYRRLGEARAAAKAAGFRGAMFPWQSGSSGREETQSIHLNPKSGHWNPDNSHLQRHVNAAIAYNAWRYFEVTRDVEFLCFYGAELILEIARFWGSIAEFNQELGRYEITGVMGPDEYHEDYPGKTGEGLNNNSYTNVMAVWVLCRALEVLDRLPADRRQELCQLLSLDEQELDRWDDISRRMRVVFTEGAVISQFEGFEELAEFDWQGYRDKYGDIQRLDRILEAESDTPDRYQVSKQADVLMLFYLFSAEECEDLFERLGYPFPADTIPKNIEYHLKRTSHGSSLSRVVHSWVLARSDRARSQRLFLEALKSDIADIQGGTTPEGIHLGAMAGTVDLVQRCFTGIETRGDVLRFNPRLPEEIRSLRMRIRYRDHSLDVEVTKDALTVESLPSAASPIRIGYRDEDLPLEGGQKIRIPIGATVAASPA